MPSIRSLVLPALAVTLLASPLPSPGAEGESTPSGAALYAKYCALCHGADARGYAADEAPSLVSPQFLSAADDRYIAGSIALGRPGTAMSAYGRELGGPLDDSDILAIVAFLRARGPAAEPLPTHERGSARRGAPIYVEQCLPCHGDRSTRGTSVRLANPVFLGLASDAFLFDAIARGREGTAMKGYAGELEDEEIADVVAYLRTWEDPAALRAMLPKGAVDAGPAVLNPEGAAPELPLREGRFVAADDVKRALDEKRRIVIVDARTSSDWLRARIPGSISVPYYALEGLDRIPDDGTWVVAYCACPHHASGVVVDELRRRGYPHAAVLDEGVTVWAERGYPVTGNAVASGAER